MTLIRLSYFKSIILLIIFLSFFHVFTSAGSLSPLVSSLIPPADGPSFVEGPQAVSRHSGNDRGNYEYGLRFYLRLSDPQGFTDIASVVVT